MCLRGTWGLHSGINQGPFQCPRPRPHLRPVALQVAATRPWGVGGSWCEPDVQTSVGTTDLGPEAKPASQTRVLAPSEATISLCPAGNLLSKASPPEPPAWCFWPGWHRYRLHEDTPQGVGGHAPPGLGVDVLTGQGATRVHTNACHPKALSPGPEQATNKKAEKWNTKGKPKCTDTLPSLRRVRAPCRPFPWQEPPFRNHPGRPPRATDEVWPPCRLAEGPPQDVLPALRPALTLLSLCEAS